MRHGRCQHGSGLPIQKAYSSRMIDSTQMENAMSATAARAMTHLHCQQPSCSALTASHRDSAQSACLSARPSICLSVRHTLILCRCHPDCIQFVRPSVRHTPVLCHYHPDCAQFVHPSVCPSVTLPFHRSPTWPHPDCSCSTLPSATTPNTVEVP